MPKLKHPAVNYRHLTLIHQHENRWKAKQDGLTGIPQSTQQSGTYSELIQVVDHLRAWAHPKMFSCEKAIVGFIRSAGDYADYFMQETECNIGDTGYMGDEWTALLNSVREMLNGPTGRLNCVFLDCLIIDMLKLEKRYRP